MKRLISAILSLTMIATLFGIMPFSASAADGDVNLLTGRKMTAECTTDGGKTITPVADNGKFSLINDGDSTETNAFFVGTPKFAAEVGGVKEYYADGSKVWLDLKFDIGAVKTVNSFNMVSMNGVYCTGNFDVYLSDSADNICTEENRILNYRKKDVFGEGGLAAVVEVALEEPVYAQYLVVRIIYPCGMNIGAVENVYARICEIELWGQEIPDSFYGSNLMTGKTLTASYTTDGGATIIPASDNGKFKNINDGDTSDNGQFFIGTPKFAAEVGGVKEYYVDGSKVWLDLKIDFGEVNTINLFRLFNCSNGVYYTGNYDVYFAESEEDLLKESSKKITFRGKDNFSILLAEQEFIFNEPFKARYMVVRVLHPCSMNIGAVENCYTRINELQVLGKPVEESYYGSNILSGVKATAQHTTDGGNTMVKNNYDLTRLTDGDLEKLCYINEPLFAENIDGVNTYYTDGSKVWLDIKFDLGRRSDLNKLKMFNNTNGVLATSKFKVYFADKSADLFTADNLEIDYDKHQQTQSSDLSFMLDDVTARYMGIKIIFPCTLNTSSINLVYTTIREIELIGNVLDLDDLVTFKDNKGNTVYECYAESDGMISATDLAAAKEALSEVYGYKLSDEVWNADASAPVTGDTTFDAVYVRDTETTYEVTVGEKKREYAFDHRVDFASGTGDVSWFVNGQFYDYGDKTSVYTFGEFTVTTSDAAAPTAPVVSVVGTADPAGKFITFVRVYNPTDEEIVGYGVRFTSGTVYGMMNGCEWDDDSITSVIPEYAQNKSKYIADYTVNASAPENYMVTLKGVGEGKARYAKAYVTLASGEAVFSAVSGNAATK